MITGMLSLNYSNKRIQVEYNFFNRNIFIYLEVTIVKKHAL